MLRAPHVRELSDCQKMILVYLYGAKGHSLLNDVLTQRFSDDTNAASLFEETSRLRDMGLLSIRAARRRHYGLSSTVTVLTLTESGIERARGVS